MWWGIESVIMPPSQKGGGAFTFYILVNFHIIPFPHDFQVITGEPLQLRLAYYIFMMPYKGLTRDCWWFTLAYLSRSQKLFYDFVCHFQMIKIDLFYFWHLYFTGLCRLTVACVGLTMIDLGLVVLDSLSFIHFSLGILDLVYCCIVTYYELCESECVLWWRH